MNRDFKEDYKATRVFTPLNRFMKIGESGENEKVQVQIIDYQGGINKKAV